MHADSLISSANKCVEGVPGFAFVLARRDRLMAAKGLVRTLVSLHQALTAEPRIARPRHDGAGVRAISYRIYPGKLTQERCFGIGTIGRLVERISMTSCRQFTLPRRGYPESRP